jgi:hypothetical protein
VSRPKLNDRSSDEDGNATTTRKQRGIESSTQSMTTMAEATNGDSNVAGKHFYKNYEYRMKMFDLFLKGSYNSCCLVEFYLVCKKILV